MKPLLAAVVLLAVAAGGWWVLSDPRRAVETVPTTTVDVGDNWFSDPVIEVAVDQPVTWTFVGQSAHDVVGDGWRSPEMATGEFAHTFTTPGTYDYVCSVHPISMRGRVIAG